jgi:thiol-disulfide isomerase/thioredoxin
LDGAPLDAEQLRGKAVVIKFFADYCVPCKRTLPAVERLHREHPEVAFVGVSEDDYSSAARKVVSSFGLTFPVVHDADKGLRGRFRVMELPMTFVADKTGVVTWVGGPAQTEDDLERVVESVSR